MILILSIYLAALGCWLGGIVFFSFFTAPAIFTHLPAAEAGQFQQAGYSVVICGPGYIDQAHQPDEYVEISQMERGAAFMRLRIRRVRFGHRNLRTVRIEKRH